MNVPDASRPAPRPRIVVIATTGTLGDLHPYMATALRLQERGHRVTICSSAMHRARIEAAGLGFRSLRPDPPQDAALYARLLDARRGPQAVFAEVLMPAIRDSYADLSDACSGADVLVSSVTVPAAQLVAAVTGVPWASTVLQPLLFYSDFDPPLLPPAPWLHALQRRGPAWAGAIRRVGDAVTGRWTRPFQQLRRELGLPPGANPLMAGQHSPGLVLAMFSAAFASPQPDWPPQALVTGFAFYDRDDEGRESPRGLQAFLADGEPALVFTLGSSAVHDPGEFYAESLRTARELGRRALLLVGSAANRASLPATLPPGIAAFEYAPYAQVFPRAAAIVHQGGIGTTAQALRAGRPQLVVPYAHDQPDNAARAERLGVAAVLGRARYAARRVAPLLAQLLQARAVADRAAGVAARLASEDGAGAACAAIERA